MLFISSKTSSSQRVLGLLLGELTCYKVVGPKVITDLNLYNGVKVPLLWNFLDKI